MRALDLALAALLVAAPLVAAAADDAAVPSLKGEWVADSFGVSLGDPAKGRTVDEDTSPAVAPNHIVMTIDFQDGRHIAGIKRHAYGHDRFVGAIRLDNRTVAAADAEGDMDIRLLGEHEMEACYTEHSRHFAFASCAVYRRQP